MKTVYRIAFITALAFVLSACSSKEDKLEIDGIWNIVKYETATKATTIGSEKVDIYLEFKSDNTMALYEKRGTDILKYQVYKGTWLLEGNILSGYYTSSGKAKAWNNKRKVERVGEQLIMISLDPKNEEKTLDKETYQLVQEVPKEVLDNCRLDRR